MNEIDNLKLLIYESGLDSSDIHSIIDEINYLYESENYDILDEYIDEISYVLESGKDVADVMGNKWAMSTASIKDDRMRKAADHGEGYYYRAATDPLTRKNKNPEYGKQFLKMSPDERHKRYAKKSAKIDAQYRGKRDPKEKYGTKEGIKAKLGVENMNKYYANAVNKAREYSDEYKKLTKQQDAGNTLQTVAKATGAISAGAAANSARLKIRQMKLKGQLKELTAVLGETNNPAKQKELESKIDKLQKDIADVNKKLSKSMIASGAAAASSLAMNTAGRKIKWNAIDKKYDMDTTAYKKRPEAARIASGMK